MKKEWSTPILEVLDVNMTMAGPGIRTPDAVQPDPDSPHHDVVNYS
ncbi:paeninodin family lasso peptide [Bacillus sp. AFS017336]|nr:paeninodin family lasso peptide [Bacillus sp. AFS017336]